MQPAGSDLRELFGQAHVRLVRVERRDVLQFGGLLLNRGGHLLVAMADADGDDAAVEVEKFFSFDVVNVAPLGMINHERLIVVVSHDGKEKLFVLVDDFLFFHPKRR